MENKIDIYKDQSGETQIDVRFEEESVWLTQKHMASLFGSTPQNITLHLKNIYQEEELSEDSTCKRYLQVQKEGNRQVKRNQLFYNLDAG